MGVDLLADLHQRQRRDCVQEQCTPHILNPPLTALVLTGIRQLTALACAFGNSFTVSWPSRLLVCLP